jgi:hypothetical protein
MVNTSLATVEDRRRQSAGSADSGVDAALVHEVKVMKRSDPNGYRGLVALLPRENREMIERIERDFGI